MSNKTPHSLLSVVIEQLNALRKQYRPVLDAVARLYAHPPKDAPWPKGIVPLVEVVKAYENFVARRKIDPSQIPPLGALMQAKLLQTYGLWRLTKGAYIYDEALVSELIDTSIDRLPVELITRLPEPATLVLLPQGSIIYKGQTIVAFFAFLDWDPRENHIEIVYMFFRDDGTLFPVQIDLDAETLDEAIEKTFARSAVIYPEGIDAAGVKKDYRTLIAALLNLTLFLAQDEPDLSEAPPRPEPRQIKRSGHAREPAEPKIILTGWRWGSAIRRAHEARTAGAPGEVDSGSGRRSVTPHIRRAHWHLYWTGEGSRKDPSKAVPRLRWVPATLVGRAALETPDEAPVTVRPVRQDGK